jgi:hypothetical protein
LLRYEIVGAGLGLYVDSDVFCLRPIEDADYILGWETTSIIGSSVLKLPPDCPTLAALRAIKDAPSFAPPWQKRRKRRFKWLERPTRARPLERLPWGSVGPLALTYYAKQHGIDHLACPVDRFSPVHWKHVRLLCDPAVSLQELTTYRTDAVHLFTSSRYHAGSTMLKGSPIWEIANSGE